MNRLLVALLSAVDALVAVAVGLVAALAPLTVMWAFGLGGGADWTALWPAAARVWQLGHAVPVAITLPEDYLAVAGVSESAASFVLSVGPLAFAAFTMIFAARSGARAARAWSWPLGVGAGILVVAVASTVVWATSGNDIATASAWPAIAYPTLLYGIPAALGAIVVAWREGDDGVVDAARNLLRRYPQWQSVPGAALRGAAIVGVSLAGVGAAVVALAMFLRGGQMVTLFQSSNADLTGAITLALAQLAYLPTLVVWGATYAAGPGFALGTGTAVSPAATNLGVIPGIPVLGAIPEGGAPLLLLLALLVVAAGFVAGWVARRVLRESDSAPQDREPLLPRVVVFAAIVALSAAGAAIAAALSAGAFGPGRLEHVGPDAGAFALAVAIEVAVGAAIGLLAPAHLTEALREGELPWTTNSGDDPKAAAESDVQSGAEAPASRG